MSALIPLLSRYLPLPIALKALQKKFPKLYTFVTNAGAAGVATDQAMDFLRSRLGGPGEKERLQSSQHLRPDEQANLQELEQAEGPRKAIQGAASLATGIGAGGAALNQERMQQDEQGQGQIGEQQQQSQPVPSDIFTQKYPELAAFINSQLEQGKSPFDAARIAKASKKLKKQALEIENEFGQTFEELVKQIYTGQSRQAQQPQESGDSDLLSAIQNLQSILGKR